LILITQDPFLRISKVVETAGPIPICKTEVVPDNLNPFWRPIHFNITAVWKQGK